MCHAALRDTKNMSQKNSTLNLVIHDVNGQPRMVKVVQNSNNNQSAAQVKIKSKALKIIKLPATSTEGNNQVPVYKTVKLNSIKCSPKLVPLPYNTLENIKKQIAIIPKIDPTETPKVQIKQEPQELTEAVADFVPARQPRHTATSTSAGPRPDMSYTARRRQNTDNDPPAEYTTKRRKHADKVGKGLRHFSMKVCEKVRTKGFTSYNEVADELVAEFAAGIHGSADSQQYDQKNIRRRVYDALNVLMAMNIISKEKKEIRWLGLPTNSIQECTTLEKEKQNKLERIQKKTQQLQELILQHISFKSLIERNKDAESKGLKPSPSSAIHLPFIVVNTSDKALIDCSISNDKTEYMFNFNKKFQIHDDIDILKRMGLLFGLEKGKCSTEEIEKAKSMVPKSLEHYVECMGRGITANMADLLEDADEDADVENDDEDEDDEEVEADGEPEAEGEADGDEPEEPEVDASDDDSNDVYV
ncbi:hypothetical protein JYU34_002608 [Plutella xylostella]|uniref:Transcription factor Dp-1 n=1 Tax=Plutella xylostella TaxID=51655 RepID=A0ABQ7R2Q0_PLUXY|nr:hypothetical protein JYU34_002608 [Plutella xylostella]